MSDEPDNLVLHDLPRIDHKIDRRENRCERIERRFDLVDGPIEMLRTLR